jgi:acyl-CoA synthetase (NDP forming)
MFGAARRVALATTTKTPRASVVASPSPFRLAAGHVRFLNVHEYISMELFKTHGIATPECYVADTAEEAEHIATTALNRRTYRTKSPLRCSLAPFFP